MSQPIPGLYKGIQMCTIAECQHDTRHPTELYQYAMIGLHPDGHHLIQVGRSATNVFMFKGVDDFAIRLKNYPIRIQVDRKVSGEYLRTWVDYYSYPNVFIGYSGFNDIMFFENVDKMLAGMLESPELFDNSVDISMAFQEH